jgi:eukaryotic-like serine/threonine-protein kinase
VTNPQDPFGHNPFSPESLSYDPLGRAPYAPPPPGPPVFMPPPPPPQRPVNTFATLSLVFAFVFAPVGAILGHLGLAQIRRTGERGRDRALIGLSVSYAFILLTVVALTGWVTLNTLEASRPHQAAAPATTAPATTSEPPPAPKVGPDDITKLLPKLDALKSLTNDQNLQPGETWDRPGKSDKDATIDRPQCWGAMTPGAPEAYTLDAILRYRAEEFSDTQTMLKSIQIIQAVIAFRDPPTAQTQVTNLVDGWRQCGGAPVTLSARGGPTYTLTLSPPADAGNGITTMDLAPKGLKLRFVRAAAAKANVVVDLYVVSLGTTDASGPRQTAVSLANYILNKIPD